ncbi:sulfite exporter TauE/SafE family protein [cf. Phormidesmis sp. LEGE 11477]|uniref:sulfite exporter TauE/SafE family protein n=1 Tax=cf. Phormidesmis sp. LEGE 11477 TaxID=1828680 RepID=UPI00187EEFB4|nr:sulfite exporter TauE/SafE family protein [cf. Phormidesmis sp. LEGE 11477]MBE9060563.1 sulfite exporter TauE/SafE family protein [cf. Phormidesmis sp. LEGE 11477]
MAFEVAFLLVAAIAAGGINAIAGGGGLLVFPALVLTGISPISANATSAAGIWVGMLASSFAYRSELKSVSKRLWPVTIASLAGGALGAWLLLTFSDEGFAIVVPYLVAIGTLLFALSPQISALAKNISRNTSSRSSKQPESAMVADELPLLKQPLLLWGQGLVSIYGGFFGGGAGILMLTLLRLTNPGRLQTLQSVKVWMALCINAAALSYFVFANIINWPYAALVAMGTSAGGYSSAYFARRVSTVLIRRFVIATGTMLSIYFFLDTLR